MTRPVRWALGLWCVVALAVCSVTFDRQTRAEGIAFSTEQLRRHSGGLPVISINDGFRPRVRAAALRSGGWLALMLGAGGTAAIVASRASKS